MITGGEEMVLKLIGSFLIIAASSFMGFYISWLYSEKIKQIRDIQFAFNLLESEIIYSSEPLYIAFKKIGEKFSGPMKLLFTNMSDMLLERKKDSVYDAFLEVYEKFKDSLYFDKEELEIIKSFLHGIGSSDLEGQKKNFNIALKKLEIIEKKLEEKRLKNDKLIKYIGFSFGAVIVVILF